MLDFPKPRDLGPSKFKRHSGPAAAQGFYGWLRGLDGGFALLLVLHEYRDDDVQHLGVGGLTA